MKVLRIYQGERREGRYTNIKERQDKEEERMKERSRQQSESI